MKSEYLRAYGSLARQIQLNRAFWGWARGKGILKSLIRKAMYGYYEYPRLSDQDRGWIDAMLDSVN